METNYEYKLSFISIIIIGSYIACYPLAFTIRDMSHKTIGKKNTQKLILVSAIINIFTPIYFYIVANIPADSSWQFNEAFQLTLSPVLRISIASIVGSTIAELVDTEIYHFFVTKITKRYQWLRVLISNAFSIPVDNLLFVIIAFYGALPFEALVGIFVFNFFVKYAVTIVSVPMIYLVKENKQ